MGQVRSTGGHGGGTPLCRNLVRRGEKERRNDMGMMDSRQDLSTCKEGTDRMGSRMYRVLATLVWRIAVSASQRPRQHGTSQSAAPAALMVPPPSCYCCCCNLLCLLCCHCPAPAARARARGLAWALRLASVSVLCVCVFLCLCLCVRQTCECSTNCTNIFLSFSNS